MLLYLCMNKRRLTLLKFLLSNGNNDYKVVEIRQIFSKIKKYKNNFKLFEEDIYFLNQIKKIDLKYLDVENVCYCILDSSVLMNENIKYEKKLEKKLFVMILISSIICGVMSFIGAFFANLLVW